MLHWVAMVKISLRPEQSEHKKYLVTGGSGFIRSVLVRRLVQAGHTVRVLDNNSRGTFARLNDVKHRVEFVETVYVMLQPLLTLLAAWSRSFTWLM